MGSFCSFNDYKSRVTYFRARRRPTQIYPTNRLWKTLKESFNYNGQLYKIPRSQRYTHSVQISENWLKRCSMFYLNENRVFLVCDWWRIRIIDFHLLQYHEFFWTFRKSRSKENIKWEPYFLSLSFALLIFQKI